MCSKACMDLSGALGLGVGALLCNRHVSWHTTETLHWMGVCEALFPLSVFRLIVYSLGVLCQVCSSWGSSFYYCTAYTHLYGSFIHLKNAVYFIYYCVLAFIQAMVPIHVNWWDVFVTLKHSHITQAGVYVLCNIGRILKAIFLIVVFLLAN